MHSLLVKVKTNSSGIVLILLDMLHRMIIEYVIIAITNEVHPSLHKNMYWLNSFRLVKFKYVKDILVIQNGLYIMKEQIKIP